MNARGADLVLQALTTAGIDTLFSLSGNQIMPIFDACLEAGVKLVHTRHESAAVYMAEAYAQLSGRVGVALVTAGAGAANAIGPLFTASESQTPVVLLTGDSPVAQDKTGAFQELDQTAMTAPVTKLSVRLRSADTLCEDIAAAFKTAQSSSPGPVHIALPFDVLQQRVGRIRCPASAAFEREPMTPDASEIAMIHAALAAARSPLVLCGPLLSATRFHGLKSLAERLNVPVLTLESPRGLNDPSLGDLASVVASSDLILNLGKRVDYSVSFGKAGPFNAESRWINVHACIHEAERVQQNIGDRLLCSVKADPRDVVQALIENGVKCMETTAWRDEVDRRVQLRSVPPSVDDTVISAQLCIAVQRQIDKARNPVLVCDGGEFGQWAQATCSAPARVINGLSGAIGGGLCYAIAAKSAQPDATVFALMGDGTVGFHLAEFETAVREEFAIVVVIGNDRRWNAEVQIQLRDYGSDRLIGCQLSDARYDLAAAALGGHGEYVTHPRELDVALDRAVSSGKPACVNVLIEGLPAPTVVAR